MKTTIFILVMLLCFLQGSIIHAETHTIKYVAEDYSGGIYASPYPITGTVTFEDTPAPLTPVKVRFQIEPDAQREKFASDLSLSVVYDTTSVRIVGDTSWPAGTLEGEFSVIPLRSGSHGFSIGFVGQRPGRLQVRWCLSPVGECTYVGMEDPIKGRCDDSWCVFFDSVVVVKERLYNNPHVTKLFNYICSFDNIPRVGDTVELELDLTFLQNAPKGVTMHIDATGYNVITPPERLDRAIAAGETVRRSFKVSPEDCRCVHRIGFTARAHGENIRVSHHINLNSVFDERGELLCITDRMEGDDMRKLVGVDYINEHTRGTSTTLHISAEGQKRDRVIIDEEERMRIMEQK